MYIWIGIFIGFVIIVSCIVLVSLNRREDEDRAYETERIEILIAYRDLVYSAKSIMKYYWNHHHIKYGGEYTAKAINHDYLLKRIEETIRAAMNEGPDAGEKIDEVIVKLKTIKTELQWRYDSYVALTGHPPKFPK